MNILIVRKTVFCTVLFFIFCITHQSVAVAQTVQNPVKELVTVRNVAVFDTLSGIGLDVSVATPLAKNGRVQVQAVGGGGPLPLLNQIRYLPNAGFVGVDTFTVALNYITGFPFLVYKSYRVLVQPSIVTARPDYAVTNAGQAVVIDVIGNDQTTTTGILRLKDTPVTNYGTVSINPSQRLVFTPAPSFSGIAHLNYAVCDTLKTCKRGQVMIGVSDAPANNDTLRVATAQNSPLFVPLRHDGYTVFTPPATGRMGMINSQAFYYVPRSQFTGNDPFILVKGTGASARYKTVLMQVLPVPPVNNMAMPDQVATPVNQSVTFNVRTNDIGALTVRSWIPPAPQQGTISGTNSSGRVTFTPAPGFMGAATFGYVLGNAYSANVETGRVQVAVGNQDPLTRTYQLSTTYDVPLFVSYEVPFSGFYFEVLRTPRNGVVTYLPGQTTQTANGQSISGYNMLRYQPGTGFVGVDSFTVLYCATPNSNCTATKIRVTVQPLTPAQPCHVQCVWPGDADHDGVVNAKDLLTLGHLLGKEGPARPNAQPQWYAQNAPSWYDPFSDLRTNAKYADADGNGRINAADTAALSLFYGRTHILRPLVATLGDGLPFVLHNLTPNPKKGDRVQIEVRLGTPENPVVNLRGFSFDFQVSGHIRDSALRMEYYPNNFLNVNAPVLWTQKNVRRGGLETAYMRTGDLLGHGNGAVGRIEFIVIEIIDGGKPGSGQSDYFTVSLENPVWKDGAKDRTISTPGYTLRIPLGREDTRNSPVSSADFSVSPSPAHHTLTVQSTLPMQALRLTNLTGAVVLEARPTGESAASFAVADFPAGLYMLSVQTTEGWKCKKVVIE
jgi:hypothetical protein